MNESFNKVYLSSAQTSVVIFHIPTITDKQSMELEPQNSSAFQMPRPRSKIHIIRTNCFVPRKNPFNLCSEAGLRDLKSPD